MEFAVKVATLILRKKLKITDVPKGIPRDNVKLVLEVWGFPQLTIEN